MLYVCCINDEMLLFVIFTDKNQCPLNCYHYFITGKITLNNSSSSSSYNVHNSSLVVYILFSCELHYRDCML